MTCDEQLELWCNGQSVHNNTTGECCPDFSCCQPKLAIPIEQRILFREGGDEVRHNMLMMFLGAAIAEIGKETKVKVYLAGEDYNKVH